jgi:hypothetical protein
MPPADLSSLLDGKPVKPETPSPHLWRAYLAALISQAVASGKGDPASAHPAASAQAEGQFRTAFPAEDPEPIFRPA